MKVPDFAPGDYVLVRLQTRRELWPAVICREHMISAALKKKVIRPENSFQHPILLMGILHLTYVARSDLERYDTLFYESLIQSNDAPEDLLSAYVEIEASGYADLSHWSNILRDRAVAQEVQIQDTSKSGQSSGVKRKSSSDNENRKKRRAWIALTPPSEPGESPSNRNERKPQNIAEITSSDEEQDLDDDPYAEPRRSEITRLERSNPVSPPDTFDGDSQDEEPIEQTYTTIPSPPGKDSATILIGKKRQPFHFPKAAIAASIMAKDCHWDYDMKSWRIESRPIYLEITTASFAPVAEFLQTGDIKGSLESFALSVGNDDVLTFLAGIWVTTCQIHLPALQLRALDEIERYRPLSPMATLVLAMAVFRQEPSLGVEEDFDVPESIAKRLVAEEIVNQWNECWNAQSANLREILMENEDLACAVYKLLHENSLKNIEKVEWMWRRVDAQASPGAQVELSAKAERVEETRT